MQVLHSRATYVLQSCTSKQTVSVAVSGVQHLAIVLKSGAKDHLHHYCAGKLEGRGVGSKNSQTPTAPADFQLAQGPGWKLGYDHRSRNPAAFSALVGGEDWSMTLSKYEYDDFIRVRLHSCS